MSSSTTQDLLQLLYKHRKVAFGQEALLFPNQGQPPQSIPAAINQLNLSLQQTIWEPITILQVSSVTLNKATENTILAEVICPNGVVQDITSIDMVYSSGGTGSYKIRWGTSATVFDIVEDRSTHLHYLGSIPFYPGSHFQITQGATVSGTATLTGVIAGKIKYVQGA